MSRKENSTSLFHKIVTWAALLLLFVAIVTVIRFYFYYQNHEETNDAQVEQFVTPVQSRIEGYVADVHFTENQFVKKGDTLLVIDPSEFESYDLQAKADVALARQMEIVSENSGKTSESQVEILKSRLLAAEADRRKIRLDLDRYKQLFKEEAATQQELENLQNQFDAADAKVSELRNSIATSGLSTKEALSQVKQQKTATESKKAIGKKSALFLSYTVITAPYDGWVGRRTIQPGQLIKAGQTVVTMVSREKWIIANFKETQIRHLKTGQSVVIHADAFPDEEFKATIASVSPASGSKFSLLPPDNSTGNFIKIEQRIPVRILLDGGQSDEKLLAGMNVVVSAEFQD